VYCPRGHLVNEHDSHVYVLMDQTYLGYNTPPHCEIVFTYCKYMYPSNTILELTSNSKETVHVLFDVMVVYVTVIATRHEFIIHHSNALVMHLNVILYYMS
jgi:hypothetical protein